MQIAISGQIPEGRLHGPLAKESRNVVKKWMNVVSQASNNLYVTAETMERQLRDLCLYGLYALASSDGCCLFSTSTGLVGISPASITAGDVLVLVQGPNCPFLMLRPIEAHYEFRGLPMVHGLTLNFDPIEPQKRLKDLAAWAGVTQKRDWFEIR
jgi:hypothetical protein